MSRPSGSAPRRWPEVGRNGFPVAQGEHAAQLHKLLGKRNFHSAKNLVRIDKKCHGKTKSHAKYREWVHEKLKKANGQDEVEAVLEEIARILLTGGA